MLSAIVLDKPTLLNYNDDYFGKILSWRNLKFEQIRRLYKIHGFDQYNNLVDINTIFSTTPWGMPRDRTQTIYSPLKFKINRPWQIPTIELSLKKCIELRVQQILSQNKKINICWSGGQDSTALLTGFLKHTNDLSQLRVLYSPFSQYEHPEYLNFLKKFSGLELVDISGDVYLNVQFDGIFVTGDGGDEFMASIDESFIEKFGIEKLHAPWADLFYQHIPNDNFIEFCQHYFALSGKEINTVLEARWWFYVSCKNQQIWANSLEMFFDYPNFSPDMVIPFYDCAEFENFIYWNLDQIIPGPAYCDWKRILRQYCYEFDGLEDWYLNKQKTSSQQLVYYRYKKIILKNQRFIYLLDDGTRIATKNLPLLSQIEFDNTHGTTLDYLFNDPR